MISRFIRKLSNTIYDHPQVSQERVVEGPFKYLKIALVTDYFTTDCLSAECQIKSLTRQNYRDIIQNWKPDLVFIESAFHGVDGNWRYELARQPKWLRWTEQTKIFELIKFAKTSGIPTVFWNKDDGAFFDAFIDVAKAFDFVFTADGKCIERYRQQVPDNVPVNTLAMPYQPAFHHFTGFHFTRYEACFIGSYYRRILNDRRRFLDMVFDACEDSDLQLNVYDRNHDRLSHHFEFRFPKLNQLHVQGKVPHRETAPIYKSHAISLNVNSVTDSQTMCSRRLLEILACGGIAVTNPSLAVERWFKDYCHVVTTREEAIELFARLRHGPQSHDLARAEAGAMYVRKHHTWTNRLAEICAIVKI